MLDRLRWAGPLKVKSLCLTERAAGCITVQEEQVLYMSSVVSEVCTGHQDPSEGQRESFRWEVTGTITHNGQRPQGLKVRTFWAKGQEQPVTQEMKVTESPRTAGWNTVGVRGD
jgi:hypothetical protein